MKISNSEKDSELEFRSWIDSLEKSLISLSFFTFVLHVTMVFYMLENLKYFPNTFGIRNIFSGTVSVEFQNFRLILVTFWHLFTLRILSLNIKLNLSKPFKKCYSDINFYFEGVFSKISLQKYKFALNVPLKGHLKLCYLFWR